MIISVRGGKQEILFGLPGRPLGSRLSGKCRLIEPPQASDLQTIFDEFTADAKMFGNLRRPLSVMNKFAQRCERHQGGRARRVCRLLVGSAVVPRNCPTTLVGGQHLETARLVAQKDMR